MIYSKENIKLAGLVDIRNGHPFRHKVEPDPAGTIDYVIIHELCHLQHPNHSPAFYKMLAKILPDWEERKYKLEHTLV